MTVPGSVNPLLTYKAAAAGGISRSLRFNSSDSAYLSRTPASAGNRKTWTWAGWIKRCALGTRQSIASAGTGNLSGQPGGGFYFNSSTDTLSVLHGGGTTANLTSAQVFRDPSAWFHLVVAYDTTQGTDSNRVKVYVNGLQITLSGTYPSQDFQTDFNNTVIHAIGSRTDDGPLPSSTANYCLADCYLIDGSALTPSSFTETDATTGQLIPKAFSGSYGSQGWHLEFADSSAATAAALGKDTSGNGNNWTPNNLSVTAGAGNDSLVDVPINGSQTDTGVGGEVRGNYCTLNPLKIGANATLTNGNLDFTSSTTTGYNTVLGTIGVSSGKWYWEVTATSSQANGFGIATDKVNINDYLGGDANGWMYYQNTGAKYNNNTAASYGSSYTTNDVIGFAFDADAGTITAYKNGVSLGVMYSGLAAGTYFPAVSDSGAQTCSSTANFGQRPFAYTAPSGFKALCTANLPAPLVTKPNTVFDVITYTGNGSTRTLPDSNSTPTSLAFGPNLLWFKSRSVVDANTLFDSVRGTNKALFSTGTTAEYTPPLSNGVTAFNSNGVNIGGYENINANGVTFVAWCWDAGEGDAVTNTQGSITSTVSVRANATAGFSIVKYAGASGGGSWGHGLGVEPKFIIFKRYTSTQNWFVFHKTTGSWRVFEGLNNTNADGDYSSSMSASSTVVTLPNLTEFNTGVGSSYLAYCFAPVVGYSAMGSFTASNGAFIYTGFRPRFLLLKCSDTAGRSWVLLDTARGQYNVNDKELYANLADAEYTTSNYDLVSNGFVVRSTSAAYNTGTWIYYAVAESPFQYARAR